MNDKEWEELTAAVTLHGYMYDRVKSPPSLLLRGVNGIIILQREPDGHGVQIHQLATTDLVAHPTIEGLLNEVGRRCGAPRMVTSAEVGGGEMSTRVQWAAHNKSREWR